MSGVITEGNIRAYTECKMPNMSLQKNGLESQGEDTELFRLIHRLQSTIGPLQSVAAIGHDHLHLKPMDTQLRDNIFAAFSKVEAILNNNVIDLSYGDPIKTIDKTGVIEAFTPIYHLIEENTDAGKYYRSLIARAFETLELGPIPPMQFAENLNLPGRPNAKTH